MVALFDFYYAVKHADFSSICFSLESSSWTSSQIRSIHKTIAIHNNEKYICDRS